jgi:hypothetical protein
MSLRSKALCQSFAIKPIPCTASANKKCPAAEATRHTQIRYPFPKNAAGALLIMLGQLFELEWRFFEVK